MNCDNMLIGDGDAAIDAYAALQDMNDEVVITGIREELLKYCELDTFAMIRIVETYRSTNE